MLAQDSWGIAWESAEFQDMSEDGEQEERAAESFTMPAPCTHPTNPNTPLSPAFSYINLDPEKIIRGFGKYGTYQMIIYAMSNIGSLIYAMETMVMSLIAAEVAFDCVSSDPDLVALDACTVRRQSDGASLACGQAPGTRFRYHSAGNRSTLVTEFGLVCARAFWSQHGTSIFMVGGLLATPVLTPLADRYGRRWCFLLPLWLTVAANIACGFAPNYAAFLACRFLAGLGTAGIGTVSYVIQIESVTASFRSVTPLIATFVWVSGYMIVGVLYYFLASWRDLYLLMSLPTLLTVSFYWWARRAATGFTAHSRLMPESIHWSITNNRTKKVKKMVLNGTYWALSLFSVDLHEDELVGYFLSGLVELPAGFIAIGLLGVCGRRTVTCLSLVAQAACMSLAVLLPGHTYLSMCFPLLAKMFNSITWASEPLLLGEMSPTSVRNVFYGLIGFVGEIASVFAPYLNHLKTYHELAPSMLIAVASVVAAVFSLTSPETKDKPLPDDLDDFDSGPFYKFVCRLLCGRTERDVVVEETPEKERNLLETRP